MQSNYTHLFSGCVYSRCVCVCLCVFVRMLGVFGCVRLYVYGRQRDDLCPSVPRVYLPFHPATPSIYYLITPLSCPRRSSFISSPSLHLPFYSICTHSTLSIQRHVYRGDCGREHEGQGIASANNKLLFCPNNTSLAVFARPCSARLLLAVALRITTNCSFLFCFCLESIPPPGRSLLLPDLVPQGYAHLSMLMMNCFSLLGSCKGILVLN